MGDPKGDQVAGCESEAVRNGEERMVVIQLGDRQAAGGRHPAVAVAYPKRHGKPGVVRGTASAARCWAAWMRPSRSASRRAYLSGGSVSAGTLSDT
jgi:hypothetical protein